MKERANKDVLKAIRRILEGEIYVSEKVSAKMLHQIADNHQDAKMLPEGSLSDRELRVFQLIGQGKSTRDIAQQLHLSSKTVDVHRAHIKEKLDLKDATALVRHAVRWVEAEGTGAP